MTPSQALDASLDSPGVDLDELTRLIKAADDAHARYLSDAGEQTLNGWIAARHDRSDWLTANCEQLLALARRALAQEAKGERVRVILTRFSDSLKGPWGHWLLEMRTELPLSDWSEPIVIRGLCKQSRVVEALILDGSPPEQTEAERRAGLTRAFLEEHGETLVVALAYRSANARGEATKHKCRSASAALAELGKEFGLGK